MGPGAHGLRGATAAGHVVVVCHPPVGTVTAPGQLSGPYPNSEATHSIHHPHGLISLHCSLLLPGQPLGASTVWARDGGTDPATPM